MSESIFSPLWYRVANIKPQLRSHVSIDRHSYRGEVWYVLNNLLSGRHHRFTPEANYLIQKLDGKRTLQSIWEETVGHFGDDAPSQEETIQLLGQLHSADVLSTDVLPDTAEILRRYEKQRKQKLKQSVSNPMYIRVPLIDPEKFLSRLQGLMKPVFGWFGGILWLVVVTWALISAGMNWPALTENVADTVLTPSNLILLWFLFPVVKALHELGHGFATKVWGGEVHEMGIMFLVFMPVPYVDASAASSFRERYKRVIVGAAGMLVEVFIAAIALFVWLGVEAGVVKTIAYNILLIASVSTLLFNANPLLRFDGYYILSDIIEIPNLANRGNQYIGYLIQKYLFKINAITSPATAKGERTWFVFYSITSFLYRLSIMVVISLFVATKFFIIGILLACWTAANMLVFPVFKHLKFLFTSPKLFGTRRRALMLTGGTLAGIAVLLFIVPASQWSNTEGVVWLPEKAKVRAHEDCKVVEMFVSAGDEVQAGQELFRCENIELVSEATIAEAKQKEAEIRYIYQVRNNNVKAEIAREAMRSAKAHYARATERVENLIIRSPSQGVVRIPFDQDLAQQLLKKGDTLAYIEQTDDMRVRTILTQDQIGLARESIEKVELKYVGDSKNTMLASIIGEVPGASNQLPSAALGNSGGGKIAVDPREMGGFKTFQKIFQFDIALPQEFQHPHYGARVYVRLHHEDLPLGLQWYRSIRQLFLGEFGV